MLRDAVMPPQLLRLLPTPAFVAIVLGGIAVLALEDPPPRTPPPLASPLLDIPMLDVASFRRLATPDELALAKSELAAYAFEAFPRWAVNHVDRTCPDRLLELNREMPSLHAVDPWGTPYQFLCGEQHRVVGLRTRSAGPDRTFDTSDDLASD